MRRGQTFCATCKSETMEFFEIFDHVQCQPPAPEPESPSEPPPMSAEGPTAWQLEKRFPRLAKWARHTT